MLYARGLGIAITIFEILLKKLWVEVIPYNFHFHFRVTCISEGNRHRNETVCLPNKRTRLEREKQCD